MISVKMLKKCFLHPSIFSISCWPRLVSFMVIFHLSSQLTFKKPFYLPNLMIVLFWFNLLLFLYCSCYLLWFTVGIILGKNKIKSSFKASNWRNFRRFLAQRQRRNKNSLNKIEYSRCFKDDLYSLVMKQHLVLLLVWI